MDSLRIILILIGLAVLAAIWLLHKPEGSRKPGAVRREGRRVEPGLEGRTSSSHAEDAPDFDAPGDGNDDPDSGHRQPRQASLPDFEHEDPQLDAPARSESKPDRKSSSGPKARVEPDIDPALLRARATAATGAASDRTARREPGLQPESVPENDPAKHSELSKGYDFEPATKAAEKQASTPTNDAPPKPTAAPDRTPPDAEWRESESVQREARAALLSEPESPGTDPPRIVTLYVRARGERLISGLSLLDAAIKAGLRFGEMKIFHRRHQGASKPVFSMANISRPGSFDPSGWNLFETPGVTLFMTLPGPVSALDAWDAMLATGKRLSELLEADLLDDSQCLVTRQRIAQIREDMREYDRKAGLLR